jgi:hypothetical protein
MTVYATGQTDHAFSFYISPYQPYVSLRGPPVADNGDFRVICYICNKLVKLETAATDEAGRTVHERCYVVTIRQLKPSIPLKS